MAECADFIRTERVEGAKEEEAKRGRRGSREGGCGGQRRAVAAVKGGRLRRLGMFALKSVIARTKGSKWESSKR